MEQTDKKKKNIQTIVGMVVGALTIFLVQHFLFKAPTYDQVMMQAASEINKSCPLMVDQETRLDNTMALPENVFQYNYTLVNMEKATTNIAELENYLKPTLINSVKTNPNMKINRDNKTTMGYFDKDRKR
ncbi:MAG TPA: hypothetical protein VJ184_08015 [Chryseolinea sp.]|nr:hypothetical protein [Chryseolinea sp.]